MDTSGRKYATYDLRAKWKADLVRRGVGSLQASLFPSQISSHFLLFLFTLLIFFFSTSFNYIYVCIPSCNNPGQSLSRLVWSSHRPAVILIIPPCQLHVFFIVCFFVIFVYRLLWLRLGRLDVIFALTSRLILTLYSEKLAAFTLCWLLRPLSRFKSGMIGTFPYYHYVNSRHSVSIS